MDDNTLMRLGISEEWEEAFGKLKQLSNMPSKKWDSGIEDMNEALRKERRRMLQTMWVGTCSF